MKTKERNKEQERKKKEMKGERLIEDAAAKAKCTKAAEKIYILRRQKKKNYGGGNIYRNSLSQRGV
jgi:hypothetical protein